ncbi:MAG: carboxypeptidase regulatory-like domain-containing protein [Caldilineaceae bacterium]
MYNSTVHRNLQKFHVSTRIGMSIGVSVLSLACLLLLFGPVWAQNVANSPDAPGTISGTVTNEQGAPLAGIGIHVCGNRYYYCDTDLNGSARFVTQADGSYKVTGLGPGIYQIQFIDPQHVYASEYYDNATQFSTATGIPVSGNNITNINAVLALGGAISGSITGVTGTVLNNVYVSLYLSSTNPLRGSQGPLLNQSLESGETDYLIGGLPAGAYYLCASAYLGDNYATYVTECYDNIVMPVDDLTPISTQAGQTTSGINLVLGENPAYAQLSGRITATDGSPVPSAYVAAVTQEPYYYGYSSTNSDENGYYTFTTIISDVYTVMASAYQNYGDLVTYYGNVATPAKATYFSLPAGAVKTDVNITMLDGGVLQGRIILADKLIPSYGEVTIYYYYENYFGDGSSYWFPIRSGQINPVTGEYFMRGIPDGTYRIGFSGYYATAYFSKYYTADGSEVYTVEEASDVSVNSTEPVNIDFVFTTKFFEGSIRGLAGADGQPLEGIRVDLYDGYGYPYYGYSSIVYTFTDAQGFYRFDGLNDGYYSVSFSDPAGKYATVFYSNASDPYGGSAIPVFEGEQVYGINATMTPGGSIAGTVKGLNGQPLPNVSVTVYDAADPYFYPFPMPTPVKSDQNGAYVVTGLTTGIYKICFQDLAYVLPSLCYGGASYIPDSRDVAVVAGSTTDNIDIVLGTPDLPNKLYMPVAAQNPVLPPIEVTPVPTATPAATPTLAPPPLPTPTPPAPVGR